MLANLVQILSKIGKAVTIHKSCRLKLGRVARSWYIVLIYWYWSRKTVVCEKSEYFLFLARFFYFNFSKKSEREYLQLYWLYFSSDPIKNNIWKASGSNGSVSSLNSFYLWNNKDYCSQQIWELCICIYLDTGTKSWKFPR